MVVLRILISISIQQINEIEIENRETVSTAQFKSIRWILQVNQIKSKLKSKN